MTWTVLIPLLLVSTPTTGFASVSLPSFDYLDLNDNDVFQTVARHGMITLRNIPGYAAARREYLLAAAQCARTSSSTSRKRLNDGTERFTLTSSSSPEDSTCPEYKALHSQLNTIIEQAVDSFGNVVKTNDVLIGRVIESAETLDHFHLYLKPAVGSPAAARTTAAVDLHTDNGLMIALTTPMFLTDSFEVLQLPTSTSSGLQIKDIHGKLVEPHLPPDELVLMIGEGFVQWTESGAFRPVVHQMTMPKVDQMAQRAWFGKMFVLPNEAVMKNTDLTFGSYKNATRRLLMDEGISDQSIALACPVGRRLVASDNECNRKICTANAGADDATQELCNTWCNDEMRYAQMKCKKSCSCQDNSFLDGEMCWMLCLENISCAAPTVQECNEDTRELECVQSPAPVVPEPQQPTPSTTIPSPSDKPSAAPSPSSQPTPSTTSSKATGSTPAPKASAAVTSTATSKIMLFTMTVMTIYII